MFCKYIFIILIISANHCPPNDKILLVQVGVKGIICVVNKVVKAPVLRL